MHYPIEETKLKHELAQALNCHITILKEAEEIEADSQAALLFMFRSFSFMLERVPHILLSDDVEELYFCCFQYYNLLAELKQNIAMTYPYAQLAGQPLAVILADFPYRYQTAVNQWWEEKTQLTVDYSKQTIPFTH